MCWHLRWRFCAYGGACGGVYGGTLTESADPTDPTDLKTRAPSRPAAICDQSTRPTRATQNRPNPPNLKRVDFKLTFFGDDRRSDFLDPNRHFRGSKPSEGAQSILPRKPLKQLPMPTYQSRSTRSHRASSSLCSPIKHKSSEHPVCPPLIA